MFKSTFCWFIINLSIKIITNNEARDDNNNRVIRTEKCETNHIFHIKQCEINYGQIVDFTSHRSRFKNKTKQVRFYPCLISICNLQIRAWVPYLKVLKDKVYIISFSAEFRHPVEGSLYAASHRRSTQNHQVFFCVCVFERLFISRYKSEFLNCGIFVFSISIYDNWPFSPLHRAQRDE